MLDETKIKNNGESFIDDVEKLITDLGGKLLEKNSMGKKVFARPIKRKNTGIYWDIVFELDASKEKEYKENFRMNHQVIRLVNYIYDRPENPVTIRDNNKK